MYHLGELSTDGFLNIASILKISKPVSGNFHLFSKRTIFLTVFCKVIITINITPVSEEYREFTTRIYFAHILVNSLLFLVYCNFDVVQNYRSTQGGKWALLPTTGLLSQSSIGHASTSVRNSPTILIGGIFLTQMILVYTSVRNSTNHSESTCHNTQKIFFVLKTIIYTIFQ